jgi:D-alanyl-D-alanine dipeptidase
MNLIIKFKFIIYVLFLTTNISAETNEFGLKILNLNEYRSSIITDPYKELVDLEEKIPDIILDIRYATNNNFTKKKIYNLSKAYLRKPVAESLLKAQMEFKTLGYSIKIYDAYRPYSATVTFYNIIKDLRYVASPKKGSRHNKGCAVDLTLVDIKSKLELKMPTEYDSFQKDAWSDAPVSDPTKRKNRNTLIRVLTRYGFQVNRSEWWHFDYKLCKNFEILDIGFEELE